MLFALFQFNKHLLTDNFMLSAVPIIKNKSLNLSYKLEKSW